MTTTRKRRIIRIPVPVTDSGSHLSKASKPSPHPLGVKNHTLNHAAAGEEGLRCDHGLVRPEIRSPQCSTPEIVSPPTQHADTVTVEAAAVAQTAEVARQSQEPQQQRSQQRSQQQAQQQAAVRSRAWPRWADLAAALRGVGVLAAAPDKATLEPGSAGGKRLVGRSVLYHWADVGWCSGVVERANGDKSKTVDGAVVNIEIYYDVDGDLSSHVLEHGRYQADGPADSWVLLEEPVPQPVPEPEPVPEAATVQAAAPAPVAESSALGLAAPVAVADGMMVVYG